MRSILVFLLAFGVLAVTAAPSGNLGCEFSGSVEPFVISVKN